MLYTPVKVTATVDQLGSLKSDLKKPFVSIEIRLKGKKDVDNDHTLLLTRAQIDSINHLRSEGKRKFKTIQMSKHQIKKNISHQGGFSSFLAGLASKALLMLAKGLAGGFMSGVADQVLGNKKSGDGLYLFKRGHCIKVEPVKGNGLYLTPHSSKMHADVGDGLYLKRGGAVHNGEGLILGKNSPFKNAPILGWIL